MKKIYLPKEIWIIIYEFEGLAYDYIKNIKLELDMLSCKCICKKNGEGDYSNDVKKYYGVCPIHWGIWQNSIYCLKHNPMKRKTIWLSHGIWEWKHLCIPKWIEVLKNKINNKDCN